MKYLFFSFFILTLNAFPQNIKKLQLFLDNDLDIQKAYTLDIDHEHLFKGKDGAVILYVDEDEFKSISESGLNYEILIDDWKAYYLSLPKLTEAEKDIFRMDSERDFKVSGFGYGSMGGYYTLAEIEEDLDEMFLLYPNIITQKFSIGTSVEGRTIWAVKISDDPNTNEDEPKVGFDALVHAREPQSMATQMYFIWYLLENYGTDPEATYLVDNREIYCVPCFNPDGYEYNRQTNPNGGGNWRKNRSNNGGGCYGVDLNRNFSYKWGFDNLGSSPDPCSGTYRGPSAFSEPEAQAIRDLAIEKNYGTHFNMHAYGGYILYPWGYIEQETPDSSNYRDFAALLTSNSGYAFGYGGQLLGYNSNGSIRDWMYGEQVIKNKTYGYTIEIGEAFWPNQSQIFPIAQQNLRTMIYQSFLAGEYVKLENANFGKEYFLPSDNVELEPEFKNIGLTTAYNLNFEIVSPSQYITINTGSITADSIEARSNFVIDTPLSFTISSSAPLEEEIKIILKTNVNGDLISSDTLNLVIGFPVFIFEDSTHTPNTYWTITKTPSNSPEWDSTYKSFYSEPSSYTDSKNGNYVNSATVTMALNNPIDLTGYINPRLRFVTRYDIESNWDYGQVQVSTNNGSTWIALEGDYTEPGVGSFQPNGEPLYDGTNSNWVNENISLANYISSQFKIRFKLRTDSGTTRDGWYVDDIGVFIYTIPTDMDVDEGVVHQFKLEQNYPNPFNPSTRIKYAIGSRQFVTLKVYDMLGNEVAILVNQEKSSGSYELEFDASGLTSGIYFYKLQAGEFTETKKMILLR